MKYVLAIDEDLLEHLVARRRQRRLMRRIVWQRRFNSQERAGNLRPCIFDELTVDRLTTL